MRCWGPCKTTAWRASSSTTQVLSERAGRRGHGQRSAGRRTIGRRMGGGRGVGRTWTLGTTPCEFTGKQSEWSATSHGEKAETDCLRLSRSVLLRAEFRVQVGGRHTWVMPVGLRSSLHCTKIQYLPSTLVGFPCAQALERPISTAFPDATEATGTASTRSISGITFSPGFDQGLGVGGLSDADLDHSFSPSRSRAVVTSNLRFTTVTVPLARSRPFGNTLSSHSLLRLCLPLGTAETFPELISSVDLPPASQWSGIFARLSACV